MQDQLVTALNGVAIGMLIYTLAVGLSLIFGAMDVLNLAHGAVFLAGAYVAYTVASGSVSRFLVAILIAIAVGGAIGIILWGLTALTRGRGHLDQAVLTWGLALIASEVMASIWGSDVKSVSPPAVLGGSISLGNTTYPIYRLAVIAFGLIVAGVVFLSLNRTSIGLLLRATVADRQMAAISGVSTRLLAMGTFAAGTCLAAIGGILAAPVMGVSRGLDVRVLILALVVVIVGGLGSTKGAFFGSLIIGEVETLGVALLPQLSSILLFAVLALIIIFKPRGLAGRAGSVN